MYKRGQFAMIGKTTIKALRIYDEIGLLKPDRIDNNNQYKYYSPSQIDEIFFINELKSFGFSLDEIKAVKGKNDSEYLKACLEKKLSQLKVEMMGISKAREALERKINSLDSGGMAVKATSKYIVEVVEMNEVVVASYREKINMQDVGRLIGKVYEAIYGFSLEAVDSHMIIYYDNELDSQNGDWDIEVCIPVNKSVNTTSFSTKTISRKICAKTLHVGAISEIGKAHAAVIDWTKENAYEIMGPPAERYLTSRQAVFNPGSLEIEVYYPVQYIG